MTPEETVNLILYRDGLILILNKPAGIAVHAGPKGGENLEQYFDALRFGFPNPPALAHRLDRDTSGCLVLGRHRKALKKLGQIFSAGRAKKTYWAVVKGRPPEAEGRIDLPLMKQTSSKRSWWMKVDKDGMTAITDYKILGEADGLSWLELKPQTGRTHQIRVHCEAIGCPIVGDPVYGKNHQEKEAMADLGKSSLQLHARAIELPLYHNREPILSTAPVPPHIAKTLERFGFSE